MCAHGGPEPCESLRSHWAPCHDTNSSREPNWFRDPRPWRGPMTLFVDPKFGTGATTYLQTRTLWTSRVPPARVRMELSRLFVTFSVLNAVNLALPIRMAPPPPQNVTRPHAIAIYATSLHPSEIHGPACRGLAPLYTNVMPAVVWPTTPVFSEFRASPLRQASASPVPLLTHSSTDHTSRLSIWLLLSPPPETNLPPGT